jgi:hypothetical protein
MAAEKDDDHDHDKAEDKDVDVVALDTNPRGESAGWTDLDEE